jgi:hypothetical protein
MAKKKIQEDKESIKKQELYQQQWVDTYFNTNLNGRMTSKFLKPHLTLDAAEVDAARMLGNARVKELIEIKQEQIRIKQEVTLEFIVNGLKSIIYDVMQEEVERDQDGRITSKPDRKSALAAYQQLTKIAGFEAPKKQEVSLTGPIDISKLVSFDDEEKQSLND